MTWCDHKLKISDVPKSGYYYSSRGEVFFVHEYELGGKMEWATFKKFSKEPHRVNSVDLPWQNTREAAEEDLKAFAKKRSLRHHS